MQQVSAPLIGILKGDTMSYCEGLRHSGNDPLAPI